MLTHDIELSYKDIQALDNPNALAAFFARLGYDTNYRLAQSIAAMGITSEALKTTITHVERLARQDDGAWTFEVYLFELKSLTSTTIHNLVRNFRDRSGDFLLVLTDTYQRLDFVLVERYTDVVTTQQDSPTPLSTFSRVRVRPREQTVQRRNPDPVSLRVLRRFTYTESDIFAQSDKLLSAYDVADWSEPFFNNRALFSDYYLKENLPTSPYWDNPNASSALMRSFRDLRTLYDGIRDTFGNAPERDVQHNLIEPALTSLGFTFQPAKHQHNATEIAPDYRLHAGNDAVVGTRAGASPAPTIHGNPLALCLAYAWGRSLDGKDEQRGDTSRADENPGAAVVTLLDQGDAAWAIVTNGKIWRLYSAKAHSRATNYYEIDLEETLALDATNVEKAFRYFWLLFRAAAFIPHGEQEQQKESFLDWLLSESESYALKLGERLKKRVFDEIFPHFAEGFITHARTTGQLPANLEDMAAAERNSLLEPYFAGTLTFLYRLLFLLYAESRDLLPVREMHGYYLRSLARLKEQIAHKVGNIVDTAPDHIRQSYSNSSTAFYDDLQELFSAVDKGNPDLNVPIYNGGLFVTRPNMGDDAPEMQAARFLATHKIPDRALALGLDRMSRDLDDKRHDLAFIDYKSLGVRQLGSIYEGLLEFKLRVAPVEMALVKDKKDVELVIPYTEARQQNLTILKDGRGKDAPDRTYPRGKVYLENDRRERKATGSYYTPDYIVKYIVENTVGPILTQKLESLRPLFREAELTLKNKREKAIAPQKQRLLTKVDDPEQETYNHYRSTLNEQFFDLKVLDPAMGSGHFLVEAVDYITDQMVKFLTSFKWSPVLHELAQTRRAIQQEMEEQKVTVDVSKLTDINLLKRQVLKRCIYGVDLNPMAVELAKVSLWLDCFTLGAPLSFLDHHMKAGNSLIGGNVKDVQDALSGTLWSSQFSYLLNATELMRRVGSLSDITASQVAESRTAYRGAYDALAPFKRLLNVWVSEYFANKGAQNTTRHEAGPILDAETNNFATLNNNDQQIIQTAEQLAATKRFFHWELEFPEVFYDADKRKENGGFDAVVGNPPYVSAIELNNASLEREKQFWKQCFKSASGAYDLYILFIEQAINLCRREALSSLITPNKFLSAPYAIAFRNHFYQSAKLLRLLNLSRIRVFDDPSVYPVVTVSQKSSDIGIYSIQIETLLSTQKSASRLLVEQDSKNLTELPENIWGFLISDYLPLLLKTQQISFQLKDCSLVHASSTASEADTYEHALSNRVTANDKKFINTGLIDRYNILWGINPLTHKGTSFLTPYLDISHEVVTKERRAQYGKPKLIFAKMAQRIETVLDQEGEFASANTNFAYESLFNLHYLLAIVNSSLMSILYSGYFGALIMSGGYFQFQAPQLRILPIRRINFTTPLDERTRLLENARTLYATCIATDDPACVLGFVEHHLTRQPEQADVVHDLLAFLAEEMIRLNKEKRALTRAFLDWLTTTLRILPDKDNRSGIDALTGKSKLLDYPGDYQKHQPALPFADLLDILQKNRTRLGVRLTDAALVDKIKLRYEESLGQVLPLKEQLARTDRLIDRVVYRLYGLTEEEIGVVEGRG
ncbi:MAG TPA: Eco57I restriction-modification methylase domain-containing protein [Ktedonobacteraceae bacterium]|nr:Eco57I restriction-modification methylase domain-containing protein [Ktedonobacteraceae bacterium]